MYEKSQFFSEQQDRPITIYKISQSVKSSSGRNKREKLFESTSMIQIVLYLRDVWYIMQGQELPTDNEMWEAVKASRHIDYSVVKIGDG